MLDSKIAIAARSIEAALVLTGAVTVGLAGCTAKRVAAPVAAKTQPFGPTASAKAEERQDARSLLQRLLDEDHLRLATGHPSASESFNFVATIARRTVRGDRMVTDIAVVRDGESAGILCSSLRGLPYCYMTDGLFVVLDHSNPGTLLIYQGGAPDFRITSGNERDVSFTLSYRGRSSGSTVVVDFASLLSSTLRSLKWATYDRQLNAIVARTDHGTVMITPETSREASSFPIKEFMLRSTEADITLGILEIDTRTPAPLKLVGIRLESVIGLGLPIRSLFDSNISNIPLFVPPDFAGDPREEGASRKLQNLFLRGAEPERIPGLQKVDAVVPQDRVGKGARVPYAEAADMPPTPSQVR